MKLNLRKVALGALAVLALTFVTPANPAYAINSVTCGNRTDFLKVHFMVSSNVGSARCYANSGSVAVNISGVYRVSAGANKVTVSYDYNRRFYSTTIDKGGSAGFKNVRVYGLRIW
ncbi:beta/gamma crystallin [Micromonospora sp. Llam0]|uniref:beta/gamma crystallin domain-containing protein n=1 Tax=Micromonospora sp. Llam0 TaxID=2485143 RepID=UPI000F495D59|nr:beta/gamma crystallin domain-containing protein [Micromonospora sp. Llam0]ROO62724.1 beta/gamma crystallin [Micromonospora sp. Llam0]